MPIQLLRNEPENKRNVRDGILGLIDSNKFQRIDIAVSYIMDSGTSLVLSKLIAFMKTGRVRLLFGDDFELSQSSALQKLYDANVEMRLFVGQMNYHPKVWVFQGAKESAVVIGSSNLSQPALMSNIEANVLVSDDKFVDTLRESFKELWLSNGLQIDQDWIDHYHDREEIAKSEPRYTPEGKPDFASNLKQIDIFIRSWRKYIKQPKRKRQSEYWRGWYIAPEPATFDDEQLGNLQNVLIEILRADEYKKSGKAKITKKFANDVLTKAKVHFEGRPMTTSAEGRRSIFIRQQKNKLEKLGFLCEIKSGPVVEVTELGKLFADAGSKDDRKDVYSSASHNFRWAWAPKLDMVSFVERLLKSVPQNRLDFHEMSYIVMHVFHPKMFGSTKRLVTMFKQLPEDARKSVIHKTDGALEKELESMGKGAFRHYQTKIFELMYSFGYVEGMKFHGVRDSPLSCYLKQD